MLYGNGYSGGGFYGGDPYSSLMSMYAQGNQNLVNLQGQIINQKSQMPMNLYNTFMQSYEKKKKDDFDQAQQDINQQRADALDTQISNKNDIDNASTALKAYYDYMQHGTADDAPAVQAIIDNSKLKITVPTTRTVQNPGGEELAGPPEKADAQSSTPLLQGPYDEETPYVGSVIQHQTALEDAQKNKNTVATRVADIRQQSLDISKAAQEAKNPFWEAQARKLAAQADDLENMAKQGGVQARLAEIQSRTAANSTRALYDSLQAAKVASGNLTTVTDNENINPQGGITKAKTTKVAGVQPLAVSGQTPLVGPSPQSSAPGLDKALSDANEVIAMAQSKKVTPAQLADLKNRIRTRLDSLYGVGTGNKIP